MQFLKIFLVLFLGIQCLVAKEAQSLGVSKKENGYTRNQDINAFKIALKFLGIDPEMRAFERMFSEYKVEENKLNFLHDLVMSEEGIKQFQKKKGKKPVHSDIESAYQVMLDFYEKLPKKNVYTADDADSIKSSKAVIAGEVASQLLYSVSGGKKFSNTFSVFSDDLKNAHHTRRHHSHGHHHHHTSGEGELSNAHKCSHSHASGGHGHHCHHNHHHNHSQSYGRDVVSACTCSHC